MAALDVKARLILDSLRSPNVRRLVDDCKDVIEGLLSELQRERDAQKPVDLNPVLEENGRLRVQNQQFREALRQVSVRFDAEASRRVALDALNRERDSA